MPHDFRISINRAVITDLINSLILFAPQLAPRAVSGVEKQITTSAQLCNVKFGRGKNKHKPKMTAVQFQPHIEPPYTTRKDQHREIKWTESVLDSELAEMRHKFPEFLPPDDVRYRTDVAMSLERQVRSVS